jgi:hypothetical protein
MTTEATSPIRLLVDFGQERPAADLAALITETDGFIIDPDCLECAVAPATGERDVTWALLGSPLGRDEWVVRPGTAWIGTGGLTELARLRDGWPALRWVPRVGVFRPPVGFSFPEEQYGAEFKTYMPNTAALRAYMVDDLGMGLEDWLERAAGLGFATVWLHAPAAEEAGRGLDLDMLERARRGFRGAIWISGGATEPRHLETLRREGGAEAVVIPSTLAAAHGCLELAEALRSPPGPFLPAPVVVAESGQGVEA